MGRSAALVVVVVRPQTPSVFPRRSLPLLRAFASSAPPSLPILWEGSAEKGKGGSTQLILPLAKSAFASFAPHNCSLPKGPDLHQSAVVADQKVFARQGVKNSATVANLLSPYQKGERQIRPLLPTLRLAKSVARQFGHQPPTSSSCPTSGKTIRPSAADFFVLPNQWQDNSAISRRLLRLAQPVARQFGHQPPTSSSCPTSGKTIRPSAADFFVLLNQWRDNSAISRRLLRLAQPVARQFGHQPPTSSSCPTSGKTIRPSAADFFVLLNQWRDNSAISRRLLRLAQPVARQFGHQLPTSSSCPTSGKTIRPSAADFFVLPNQWQDNSAISRRLLRLAQPVARQFGHQPPTSSSCPTSGKTIRPSAADFFVLPNQWQDNSAISRRLLRLAQPVARQFGHQPPTHLSCPTSGKTIRPSAADFFVLPNQWQDNSAISRRLLRLAQPVARQFGHQPPTHSSCPTSGKTIRPSAADFFVLPNQWQDNSAISRRLLRLAQPVARQFGHQPPTSSSCPTSGKTIRPSAADFFVLPNQWQDNSAISRRLLCLAQPVARQFGHQPPTSSSCPTSGKTIRPSAADFFVLPNQWQDNSAISRRLICLAQPVARQFGHQPPTSSSCPTSGKTIRPSAADFFVLPNQWQDNSAISRRLLRLAQPVARQFGHQPPTSSSCPTSGKTIRPSAADFFVLPNQWQDNSAISRRLLRLAQPVARQFGHQPPTSSSCPTSGKTIRPSAADFFILPNQWQDNSAISRRLLRLAQPVARQFGHQPPTHLSCPTSGKTIRPSAADFICLAQPVARQFGHQPPTSSSCPTSGKTIRPSAADFFVLPNQWQDNSAISRRLLRLAQPVARQFGHQPPTTLSCPTSGKTIRPSAADFICLAQPVARQFGHQPPTSSSCPTSGKTIRPSAADYLVLPNQWQDNSAISRRLLRLAQPVARQFGHQPPTSSSCPTSGKTIRPSAADFFVLPNQWQDNSAISRRLLRLAQPVARQFGHQPPTPLSCPTSGKTIRPSAADFFVLPNQWQDNSAISRRLHLSCPTSGKTIRPSAADSFVLPNQWQDNSAISRRLLRLAQPVARQFGHQPPTHLSCPTSGKTIRPSAADSFVFPIKGQFGHQPPTHLSCPTSGKTIRPSAADFFVLPNQWQDNSAISRRLICLSHQRVGTLGHHSPNSSSCPTSGKTIRPSAADSFVLPNQWQDNSAISRRLISLAQPVARQFGHQPPTSSSCPTSGKTIRPSAADSFVLPNQWQDNSAISRRLLRLAQPVARQFGHQPPTHLSCPTSGKTIRPSAADFFVLPNQWQDNSAISRRLLRLAQPVARQFGHQPPTHLSCPTSGKTIRPSAADFFVLPNQWQDNSAISRRLLRLAQPVARQFGHQPPTSSSCPTSGKTIRPSAADFFVLPNQWQDNSAISRRLLRLAQPVARQFGHQPPTHLSCPTSGKTIRPSAADFFVLPNQWQDNSAISRRLICLAQPVARQFGHQPPTSSSCPTSGKTIRPSAADFFVLPNQWQDNSAISRRLLRLAQPVARQFGHQPPTHLSCPTSGKTIRPSAADFFVLPNQWQDNSAISRRLICLAQPVARQFGHQPPTHLSFPSKGRHTRPPFAEFFVLPNQWQDNSAISRRLICLAQLVARQFGHQPPTSSSCPTSGKTIRPSAADSFVFPIKGGKTIRPSAADFFVLPNQWQDNSAISRRLICLAQPVARQFGHQPPTSSSCPTSGKTIRPSAADFFVLPNQWQDNSAISRRLLRLAQPVARQFGHQPPTSSSCPTSGKTIRPSAADFFVLPNQWQDNSAISRRLLRLAQPVARQFGHQPPTSSSCPTSGKTIRPSAADFFVLPNQWQDNSAISRRLICLAQPVARQFGHQPPTSSSCPTSGKTIRPSAADFFVLPNQWQDNSAISRRLICLAQPVARQFGHQPPTHLSCPTSGKTIRPSAADFFVLPNQWQDNSAISRRLLRLAQPVARQFGHQPPTHLSCPTSGKTIRPSAADFFVLPNQWQDNSAISRRLLRLAQPVARQFGHQPPTSSSCSTSGETIRPSAADFFVLPNQWQDNSAISRRLLRLAQPVARQFGHQPPTHLSCPTSGKTIRPSAADFFVLPNQWQDNSAISRRLICLAQPVARQFGHQPPTSSSCPTSGKTIRPSAADFFVLPNQWQDNSAISRRLLRLAQPVARQFGHQPPTSSSCPTSGKTIRPSAADFFVLPNQWQDNSAISRRLLRLAQPVARQFGHQPPTHLSFPSKGRHTRPPFAEFFVLPNQWQDNSAISRRLICLAQLVARQFGHQPPTSSSCPTSGKTIRPSAADSFVFPNQWQDNSAISRRLLRLAQPVARQFGHQPPTHLSCPTSGKTIRPSAADFFVLPNHGKTIRPSAADFFVLPNQWQDNSAISRRLICLAQPVARQFGHQPPTSSSCPTSGKTIRPSAADFFVLPNQWQDNSAISRRLLRLAQPVARQFGHQPPTSSSCPTSGKTIRPSAADFFVLPNQWQDNSAISRRLICLAQPVARQFGHQPPTSSSCPTSGKTIRPSAADFFVLPNQWQDNSAISRRLICLAQPVARQFGHQPPTHLSFPSKGRHTRPPFAEFFVLPNQWQDNSAISRRLICLAQLVARQFGHQPPTSSSCPTSGKTIRPSAADSFVFPIKGRRLICLAQLVARQFGHQPPTSSSCPTSGKTIRPSAADFFVLPNQWQDNSAISRRLLRLAQPVARQFGHQPPTSSSCPTSGKTIRPSAADFFVLPNQWQDNSAISRRLLRLAQPVARQFGHQPPTHLSCPTSGKTIRPSAADFFVLPNQWQDNSAISRRLLRLAQPVARQFGHQPPTHLSCPTSGKTIRPSAADFFVLPNQWQDNSAISRRLICLAQPVARQFGHQPPTHLSFPSKGRHTRPPFAEFFVLPNQWQDNSAISRRLICLAQLVARQFGHQPPTSSSCPTSGKTIRPSAADSFVFPIKGQFGHQPPTSSSCPTSGKTIRPSAADSFVLPNQWQDNSAISRRLLRLAQPVARQFGHQPPTSSSCPTSGKTIRPSAADFFVLPNQWQDNSAISRRLLRLAQPVARQFGHQPPTSSSCPTSGKTIRPSAADFFVLPNQWQDNSAISRRLICLAQPVARQFGHQPPTSSSCPTSGKTIRPSAADFFVLPNQWQDNSAISRRLICLAQPVARQFGHQPPTSSSCPTSGKTIRPSAADFFVLPNQWQDNSAISRRLICLAQPVARQFGHQPPTHLSFPSKGRHTRPPFAEFFVLPNQWQDNSAISRRLICLAQLVARQFGHQPPTSSSCPTSGKTIRPSAADSFVFPIKGQFGHQPPTHLSCPTSGKTIRPSAADFFVLPNQWQDNSAISRRLLRLAQPVARQFGHQPPTSSSCPTSGKTIRPSAADFFVLPNQWQDNSAISRRLICLAQPVARQFGHQPPTSSSCPTSGKTIRPSAADFFVLPNQWQDNSAISRRLICLAQPVARQFGHQPPTSSSCPTSGKTIRPSAADFFVLPNQWQDNSAISRRLICLAQPVARQFGHQPPTHLSFPSKGRHTRPPFAEFFVLPNQWQDNSAISRRLICLAQLVARQFGHQPPTSSSCPTSGKTIRPSAADSFVFPIKGGKTIRPSAADSFVLPNQWQDNSAISRRLLRLAQPVARQFGHQPPTHLSCPTSGKTIRPSAADSFVFPIKGQFGHQPPTHLSCPTSGKTIRPSAADFFVLPNQWQDNSAISRRLICLSHQVEGTLGHHSPNSSSCPTSGKTIRPSAADSFVLPNQWQDNSAISRRLICLAQLVARQFGHQPPTHLSCPTSGKTIRPSAADSFVFPIKGQFGHQPPTHLSCPTSGKTIRPSAADSFVLPNQWQDNSAISRRLLRLAQPVARQFGHQPPTHLSCPTSGKTIRPSAADFFVLPNQWQDNSAISRRLLRLAQPVARQFGHQPPTTSSCPTSGKTIRPSAADSFVFPNKWKDNSATIRRILRLAQPVARQFGHQPPTHLSCPTSGKTIRPSAADFFVLPNQWQDNSAISRRLICLAQPVARQFGHQPPTHLSCPTSGKTIRPSAADSFVLPNQWQDNSAISRRLICLSHQRWQDNSAISRRLLHLAQPVARQFGHQPPTHLSFPSKGRHTRPPFAEFFVLPNQWQDNSAISRRLICLAQPVARQFGHQPPTSSSCPTSGKTIRPSAADFFVLPNQWQDNSAISRRLLRLAQPVARQFGHQPPTSSSCPTSGKTIRPSAADFFVLPNQWQDNSAISRRLLRLAQPVARQFGHQPPTHLSCPTSGKTIRPSAADFFVLPNQWQDNSAISRRLICLAQPVARQFGHQPPTHLSCPTSGKTIRPSAADFFVLPNQWQDNSAISRRLICLAQPVARQFGHQPPTHLSFPSKGRHTRPPFAEFFVLPNQWQDNSAISRRLICLAQLVARQFGHQPPTSSSCPTSGKTIRPSAADSFVFPIKGQFGHQPPTSSSCPTSGKTIRPSAADFFVLPNQWQDNSAISRRLLRLAQPVARQFGHQPPTSSSCPTSGKTIRPSAADFFVLPNQWQDNSAISRRLICLAQPVARQFGHQPPTSSSCPTSGKTIRPSAADSFVFPKNSQDNSAISRRLLRLAQPVARQFGHQPPTHLSCPTSGKTIRPSAADSFVLPNQWQDNSAISRRLICLSHQRWQDNSAISRRLLRLAQPVARQFGHQPPTHLSFPSKGRHTRPPFAEFFVLPNQWQDNSAISRRLICLAQPVARQFGHQPPTSSSCPTSGKTIRPSAADFFVLPNQWQDNSAISRRLLRLAQPVARQFGHQPPTSSSCPTSGKTIRPSAADFFVLPNQWQDNSAISRRLLRLAQPVARQFGHQPPTHLSCPTSGKTIRPSAADFFVLPNQWQDNSAISRRLLRLAQPVARQFGHQPPTHLSCPTSGKTIRPSAADFFVLPNQWQDNSAISRRLICLAQPVARQFGHQPPTHLSFPSKGRHTRPPFAEFFVLPNQWQDNSAISRRLLRLAQLVARQFGHQPPTSSSCPTSGKTIRPSAADSFVFPIKGQFGHQPPTSSSCPTSGKTIRPSAADSFVLPNQWQDNSAISRRLLRLAQPVARQFGHQPPTSSSCPTSGKTIRPSAADFFVLPNQWQDNSAISRRLLRLAQPVARQFGHQPPTSSSCPTSGKTIRPSAADFFVLPNQWQDNSAISRRLICLAQPVARQFGHQPPTSSSCPTSGKTIRPSAADFFVLPNQWQDNSAISRRLICLAQPVARQFGHQPPTSSSCPTSGKTIRPSAADFFVLPNQWQDNSAISRRLICLAQPVARQFGHQPPTHLSFPSKGRHTRPPFAEFFVLPNQWQDNSAISRRLICLAQLVARQFGHQPPTSSSCPTSGKTIRPSAADSFVFPIKGRRLICLAQPVARQFGHQPPTHLSCPTSGKTIRPSAADFFVLPNQWQDNSAISRRLICLSLPTSGKTIRPSAADFFVLPNQWQDNSAISRRQLCLAQPVARQFGHQPPTSSSCPTSGKTIRPSAADSFVLPNQWQDNSAISRRLLRLAQPVARQFGHQPPTSSSCPTSGKTIRPSAADSFVLPNQWQDNSAISRRLICLSHPPRRLLRLAQPVARQFGHQPPTHLSCPTSGKTIRPSAADFFVLPNQWQDNSAISRRLICLSHQRVGTLGHHSPNSSSCPTSGKTIRPSAADSFVLPNQWQDNSAISRRLICLAQPVARQFGHQPPTSSSCPTSGKTIRPSAADSFVLPIKGFLRLAQPVARQFGHQPPTSSSCPTSGKTIRPSAADFFVLPNQWQDNSAISRRLLRLAQPVARQFGHQPPTSSSCPTSGKTIRPSAADFFVLPNQWQDNSAISRRLICLSHQRVGTLGHHSPTSSSCPTSGKTIRPSAADSFVLPNQWQDNSAISRRLLRLAQPVARQFGHQPPTHLSCPSKGPTSSSCPTSGKTIRPSAADSFVLPNQWQDNSAISRRLLRLAQPVARQFGHQPPTSSSCPTSGKTIRPSAADSFVFPIKGRRLLRLAQPVARQFGHQPPTHLSCPTSGKTIRPSAADSFVLPNQWQDNSAISRRLICLSHQRVGTLGHHSPNSSSCPTSGKTIRPSAADFFVLPNQWQDNSAISRRLICLAQPVARQFGHQPPTSSSCPTSGKTIRPSAADFFVLPNQWQDNSAISRRLICLAQPVARQFGHQPPTHLSFPSKGRHTRPPFAEFFVLPNQWQDNSAISRRLICLAQLVARQFGHQPPTSSSCPTSGKTIRPSAADSFVFPIKGQFGHQPPTHLSCPTSGKTIRPSAADFFVLPNQWQDNSAISRRLICLAQPVARQFGHQPPTHLSCPSKGRHTRPSAADFFVLPNQWQDNSAISRRLICLAQPVARQFGHQPPTSSSCPTSGKTIRPSAADSFVLPNQWQDNSATIRRILRLAQPVARQFGHQPPTHSSCPTSGKTIRPSAADSFVLPNQWQDNSAISRRLICLAQPVARQFGHQPPTHLSFPSKGRHTRPPFAEFFVLPNQWQDNSAISRRLIRLAQPVARQFGHQPPTSSSCPTSGKTIRPSAADFFVLPNQWQDNSAISRRLLRLAQPVARQFGHQPPTHLSCPTSGKTIRPSAADSFVLPNQWQDNSAISRRLLRLAQPVARQFGHQPPTHLSCPTSGKTIRPSAADFFVLPNQWQDNSAISRRLICLSHQRWQDNSAISRRLICLAQLVARQFGHQPPTSSSCPTSGKTIRPSAADFFVLPNQWQDNSAISRRLICLAQPVARQFGHQPPTSSSCPTSGKTIRPSAADFFVLPNQWQDNSAISRRLLRLAQPVARQFGHQPPTPLSCPTSGKTIRPSAADFFVLPNQWQDNSAISRRLICLAQLVARQFGHQPPTSSSCPTSGKTIRPSAADSFVFPIKGGKTIRPSAADSFVLPNQWQDNSAISRRLLCLAQPVARQFGHQPPTHLSCPTSGKTIRPSAADSFVLPNQWQDNSAISRRLLRLAQPVARQFGHQPPTSSSCPTSGKTIRPSAADFLVLPNQWQDNSAISRRLLRLAQPVARQFGHQPPTHLSCPTSGKTIRPSAADSFVLPNQWQDNSAISRRLICLAQPVARQFGHQPPTHLSFPSKGRHTRPPFAEFFVLPNQWQDNSAISRRLLRLAQPVARQFGHQPPTHLSFPSKGRHTRPPFAEFFVLPNQWQDNSAISRRLICLSHQRVGTLGHHSPNSSSCPTNGKTIRRPKSHPRGEITGHQHPKLPKQEINMSRPTRSKIRPCAARTKAYIEAATVNLGKDTTDMIVEAKTEVQRCAHVLRGDERPRSSVFNSQPQQRGGWDQRGDNRHSNSRQIQPPRPFNRGGRPQPEYRAFAAINKNPERAKTPARKCDRLRSVPRHTVAEIVNLQRIF
ncbi:hypothetical protein niasHT_027800 [Heterodera trifolii]|uniref:Uncharacterized protein n=1 Tax=Heterodera trifolii TaxID=157864 RepID=A0ABD2JFN9_9BILA